MAKSRRPRTRSSSKGSRFDLTGWRTWSSRVIDIVLIVGAVISVVYVAGLTGKVVSGYSAQEPLPTHRVRLQLVDATRPDDSVTVSSADIEGISDLELDVKIVERSTFDLRPVAGSMIISRQEDLAAARTLAQRLGLDPGQVEYRPLVNNRNHVTATLILGSSGISLAAHSNKEN